MRFNQIWHWWAESIKCQTNTQLHSDGHRSNVGALCFLSDNCHVNNSGGDSTRIQQLIECPREYKHHSCWSLLHKHTQKHTQVQTTITARKRSMIKRGGYTVSVSRHLKKNLLEVTKSLKLSFPGGTVLSHILHSSLHSSMEQAVDLFTIKLVMCYMFNLKSSTYGKTVFRNRVRQQLDRRIKTLLEAVRFLFMKKRLPAFFIQFQSKCVNFLSAYCISAQCK